MIIYLLLSSFLVSQTELHELLKVPALIIHYFEHSKAESDLSFAEYMHNHYCSEHHQCNHESAKEHELPFQCCDFTHLTIVCVMSLPEKFSFPVFESHIEHGLAYSVQFHSESDIDIWQPPKL